MIAVPPATDAPLTQVVLRRRFKRRRDRLRFGEWLHSFRSGPGERTVLLAPGAMFCLVRWHGDVYGTTRWQLVIARTGAPGDVLTRLPGVFPGALALASFSGARRVRRALSALRALERDGVVLAHVPPSYWRRFQERTTRAEELEPPSDSRIRAVQILHSGPS